MAFYPEEEEVPAGFRTEHVAVRPLRAADVDLDYEAVMASGVELRERSGSWPREDFTREENLRDLQGHETEHESRIAFTYTVTTPDGSRCLGCIYINPVTRALGSYGPPEAFAQSAGPHDAWMRFWVRSDERNGDLEAHLLGLLVGWFEREWHVTRMIYTTQLERQARLFEALAMRRVYEMDRTVGYER